MAHDFGPLFAAYADVVASLGREFTSHEFILRLAQRRQSEYIEALYAYRNTERQGTPIPFMVVHSILAQHLDQLPHLVSKAGECSSPDIFGEQQLCARWRRV